jgi:KUP system potassium uptake protein
MWAVRFMMGHGIAGLFVLGAVFLTVTGAEALIADMGHFGRRPIQLGWLTFVWPALTLNYLGQGAGPDRSGQGAGRWTVVAECRLVLLMAPDSCARRWWYWPRWPRSSPARRSSPAPIR